MPHSHMIDNKSANGSGAQQIFVALGCAMSALHVDPDGQHLPPHALDESGGPAGTECQSHRLLGKPLAIVQLNDNTV